MAYQKTQNHSMKTWAKIGALLIALLFLFVACTPATEISSPSKPLGFHTTRQAAYLSGAVAQIGKYADGTKEFSRPLPISPTLEGVAEDYAMMEVSKDPTFATYSTYPLTEGKAEIYNLEADTVYYVRGRKESGEYGAVSAFETEATLPRNLYIDGVTNARDLGGYKVEGGRVRQGLLFRTAKLNQNKADVPTPLITEAGIDMMLRTLGIKTEVDLRRNSDNEIGSLTASVLGDGVRYCNFPMTAGNDMPTANYDSLKKLFSCLADKNNYPLFFHCSIGTDRTGFSAFLMLSVLGVDGKDIARDYLFSNFGNIGGDRDIGNIMSFELFLSLYEGKTLQQKAETYLTTSVGVTKAEIEAFRSIIILRDNQ